MANKHKFFLKTSYALASLLLILHLGAMVIVSIVSTSWLFIVICGILCVLSLISTFHRHVLRMGENSIIELICKSPGQWELIDKAGRCVQGKLHNSSLRVPLVVILNFKLSNKFLMHPLIIFRDGLNQEEFRRLRVLLLTDEC